MALLGLLSPTVLLAQEFSYSVLFNTDNNDATGCSVSGGVLGIERRLSATVSSTTFRITGLTLQTCEAGTFGAATELGGVGYPVALNQGTGGSDAVELSVSESLIGTTGSSLVFLAETPACQDILSVGAPPSLNPVPVPTLSAWGLIALALLLALVGMRTRHRRGLQNMLVLFLFAGVALAGGMYVADGDLADWGGVPPAGADATGDSTCGRPDVDIVTGFRAAAGGELFFRIDIDDIEPVVMQTNSPPDLITVGNRVITVGTPFSTNLFAIDPDPGDTLSFSLPLAPAGVTLNPGNGLLQWTPGAGQLGVNNLTARVTDSGGLTDSESFTIEVIQPIALAASNSPPSLDPIGDQTLAVGEILSLQATATDPDSGDTLTFSLPLAPTGMMIDPVTGQIQWNPTAGQIGLHDVSARVEDNHGLIDVESFIVTALDVNRGPTAMDDIYNAPPGVTLHVAAPGVVDNDSDPNGDPLTATLVSDVEFGALDFRADGSFDYTPGTDTFEPKLKYRAGPVIGPGPYSRGRAELSPVVADLDRDGTPEIVVGWFTDAGLNIALRILDGVTGEIEHEIVSNRASSITAHDDTATPAIGNLDDDPELEIAIVSSCVEEVIVFEHDLTLKWSSSPGTTLPPGCPGGSGGATTFRATLADLDADGVPEILIPLQGTNNATWGVRVFNASGGIVWERRDLPIGGLTDAVGSVTVADVDLDGEPEVIVGEALLSAAGDLEWVAPASALGTYPDGALVANLDDDPYGEILLIGPAKFLALNHDGTLLWDAVALNPEVIGFGENYSTPLVADLNGDGEVEVAAASLRGITVVKRDGTLLWQRPVCVEYPDGDHCSGNAVQATVKAITAFDFDGDGVSEIAAQLFVEGAAIVRGSDGERLWSVTVYEGPAGEHSSTHKTHPVVADVDGDGHAELVMPQGSIQNEANCNADGNCVDHGIYVYEGLNDDWMPARPLYNQLSYHNTNIRNDGAIPDREQPHWLVPGLNRARVNVPLADDDSLVDRFTYRVNDGEFDSNVATARLAIRPDNHPPSILSRPQTVVGTGFAYRYKVLASDEDFGDVLTFTLSKGPAGMSIDAAGVVRWQPGASDLGSHRVSVAVTDQEGAGDLQSFLLEVVTPQPVPTVIGDPQATAESTISGAGFAIGAITQANHPSIPFGSIAGQTPLGGAHAVPGSPVDLVVSLGRAPADIDDDSDGFTENQGDCNDGDNAVFPGAPDANGDGIDQNCDGLDGSMAIDSILVVPDQLTLVAGETAPLEAFAIFADGTSQPLTALANWNSTNGGVATVNAAGVVTAQAFGNAAIQASRGAVTGMATVSVVGADPSDDTVPIAEITSPVEGETVFGPVDVVGTASDGGLVRYELSISPADENNFTPIGGGTTSVLDSTLGTFDPTLLLNDLYRIRLEVFDVGGNSTSDEVVVQVDGNQKVGNFTLTFVDLSIPLSGIPITVARTYDSRDKHKGDFGVGWRLGIQSLNLTCTQPLGDGWNVIHPGLVFALVANREHKCSLSLPGGRVEEFDFVVGPAVSPFVPFPPFGNRASFRPKPGTLGTLASLDNNNLTILDPQPGPVQLLDDVTNGVYNPQRFRYTAADGSQIVIHRSNGVETVHDTNGNTLTFGPGAITHSSGKSVFLQRDAEGRVTQLTDPMGHTQGYTYSAAGDLISHTDQLGNTTRYFYNQTHGLVRVVDPLNRPLARNLYDDESRLVSTTNSDGRIVTFAHNIGARQEVVTDVDGNITVLDYDVMGNVLSVTDPSGNVTTNVYDSDGNKTSTTNAEGETTTQTFDTRGNMLTETDPLGNTSSFTYDSADRMLGATDPLGRVTAFTYDSRGNLLARSNSGVVELTNSYDTLGNLLSETNAVGDTTQYEYDAAGNRTAFTDARGSRATFTYDANGNLLGQTDRRGKTATNVVDARGSVTGQTDPLGNTAMFQYTATGTIIAASDGAGNTRSQVIDAEGKDLSFSDALGNTSQKVYDLKGNLVRFTDPLLRETTFEFNKQGRNTNVTRPDGGVSSTVYDKVGRTVERIDARANSTTFVYDAAGRNTKVIDALSNETTFAYDSVGNRIQMIDSNGNTFSFDYDAFNRRTKTTFPGGSFETTGYDDDGRVISETDACGNTRLFEYDSNDNLVKVIDPLGHQTTYTYDEENNLLTQTDARGNTTSFAYDADGRRIARTFPDGTNEVLQYDAAGNISTTTDANGNSTVQTFDANGRLVRKQFPDGSEETFTYTATGKVASATNPRGTTIYRYDANDRLIGLENPDSSSIAYGYDAEGNRVSVATRLSPAAAPRTTTLSYDVLNRLASVVDPDLNTTNYTYDLVGNLKTITYPNAVVTTFTYDSLNRLRLMTHSRSGTELERFLYELNPVGDRTKITDKAGSSIEYDYDPLRRLTRETHRDPMGAVLFDLRYSYDAVGNRTSTMDVNGVTTVYQYDTADKLLSFGATTYSYDANGNVRSRGGDAGIANYGFDFENQLASVSTPTDSVLYEYDPQGHRVRRTDSQSATNFLVDPINPTGVSQVLMEYDDDAMPMAEYVYGNQLLSQNRAGVMHFQHRDGSQNVRLLTDSSGSVTDTYRYQAFGVPLERTGTTMNPYQFAGERVDPATNLVHLRARWYDPAVGRFGSRDPFGGALNDPISLHRYLYANANPVSFTDPAGRLTLVNLTAANFIRATLIGVAFDLSVRSAFFDERITSATIIQSIVLNAIFAGPLLKAGSLAFSASIGGFRFAGITFVNETIVAFNRILMRQGGKALNVVLIRIYYYLPGGPALLRYVRGNIGVANAVFGELSPAAFTELRSRLAVFLSVVAP